MNAVAQATSPSSNITVSAAAGSGKTWMLVTRVIRLLIAGAEADGILAITFTRKAAAEMQERLMTRLRELAAADQPRLAELLEMMAIECDAEQCDLARGLYEKLLRSNRQPSITTFHSFAQQLLHRFPLEANLPTTFDLIEQPSLLINEAMDALFAEVNSAQQRHCLADLQTLYTLIGGDFNVRKALRGFLDQRIDWWAMIEGLDDPVTTQQADLRRRLAVGDSPTDPAAFFTPLQLRLREYAQLRRLHETNTELAAAASVERALEARDYGSLRAVFFTMKDEQRKLKSSKASLASRGEMHEQRLQSLHDELHSACGEHDDLLARERNAQINCAWYAVGHRLIEVYQQIKLNRRLLDFSDLEWQAYRLLNSHDQAHWIQYRLDQRINHLLVDEFQDTNPVQWRMLLPLLEEMAAADGERQRSVFLVGDVKQAIYGFRRADALLFGQAHDWLATHLAASSVPLTTSRRSAPAVMDFVNAVFSGETLRERLPDFRPHDTHRQELWGQVTVLPLFSNNNVDQLDPSDLAQLQTNKTGLRDSLQIPRPDINRSAEQDEAEAIAAHIESLITQGLQIGSPGAQRALRYADIIILLRNRQLASVIEAALRRRRIPYFGTERGTLFECTEIQDMLALLDCLLTPYNNLAVARVLRSPLFDFSNDELAAIALQAKRGDASWYAVLQQLATAGTVYEQAWQRLAGWHAALGALPVHDLLDRIYSEANVIARYQALVPQHHAARVHANLMRFLELALEIDSGRYPSLEQFRHHLRSLHKHAAENMDIAQTTGDHDRVRIMTIHAAKGLESAVVYLADTAREAGNREVWKPLVNWPANRARPEYFVLLPTGKQRDRVLQSLQANRAQREYFEDANLLYVALTRAQQMLVISANAKQPDKFGGWYADLAHSLTQQAPDLANMGYRAGLSELPFGVAVTSEQMASPAVPAPRLAVSDLSNAPGEIAPSRTNTALLDTEQAWVEHFDQARDRNGRLRGRVIHAMLERLGRGEAMPSAREAILALFADIDDAEFLSSCCDEACTCFSDPGLSHWFDNLLYEHAACEVPLIYIDPDSGCTVNGIIDRLLVTADTVTLIDYKTHRTAQTDNIERLAAEHREQLEWYRKGIARLYPGREIECWLLFTHCNQAIRTA